MEDLDHLRKQIDEIDDALVKLFLKRMEIVCRVADYKMKNGMEVLVKSREEQIINRYTKNIEEEAVKSQLREFLQELMRISRKVQTEKINEKLHSLPHNHTSEVNENEK